MILCNSSSYISIVISQILCAIMYRALHICSTSALCFFKQSLGHAVKTAALHPWGLSCRFRFQSESPTISHSTGVRGPKYTLNVHTAAPRSLALVKKTGEGNDGMCWTPHFMIRVREGRSNELGAKRSLLRNNTMQEKQGEGYNRMLSDGRLPHTAQDSSRDPRTLTLWAIRATNGHGWISWNLSWFLGHISQQQHQKIIKIILFYDQ